MKHISLSILFLLLVHCSHAQETIGSAGQNDKVSKAQVSWNLGETIVDHGNTSSGSVTQGYEQPGFTITSIELINKQSQITAVIFPNPVVNDLNIELNGLDGQVVLLKVYDAQGKLVLETSTNQKSTHLDLSTFSGSTYHLTLHSENTYYFEKFSLIKSH